MDKENFSQIECIMQHNLINGLVSYIEFTTVRE